MSNGLLMKSFSSSLGAGGQVIERLSLFGSESME